MIIFIIIGIILSLITMYVQKHTLFCDYCSEQHMGKLPVWMALGMFIIGCIPVINVILFVFGFIVYMLIWLDMHDIEPKFFNPNNCIIKLLTKEL